MALWPTRGMKAPNFWDVLLKNYIDEGDAPVEVTWADIEDKPTTFAPAPHTSAVVTDFVEAAQDAVAVMLAQGTGVTLTYNDAANSLTIASTGGSGGLDAEAVRDAIGVAMIGVGNISVTVNDAADTITLTTTATANSTDAQLRDRSTHTGEQAQSTITGLVSALAAKMGLVNSVVNITNPTTMAFADVNITDDGSATANWPERFRFLFNGKLVSRFNEYGEFRVSSAKTNTVAVRLFGKETDAEADHSASVPIMEMVKSRQTRDMRWQLMVDGSTQQSGRPTWVVESGPTLQTGYLILDAGVARPANTPSNIVIYRRPA